MSDPAEVLDEPEQLDPVEPPPVPTKKRPPVYLSDMAYEAYTEAHRIRFTQDVMVRAGMRKAVYEPEMRKAEVFEAMAKLMDEIRPHLKAVLAITRGKRKSKG